MNVCFQNHIEEKQHSETTLLATHNDRNRRNTLKQKNNILRLSAGHPLPLPIARLLGTRFRFDFFSANLETFGNVVFCLDLLEPQSQDFWNSVFLDVSGIFNVLLKPRLNQDSCKTFRIICLIFFVFCRGAKTSGKLVLKAKNTFQLQ